ncbi:MAG: secondary thiamine-phosphate synthase enzyme YjbQ [Candidatus Heimdallarchaeota archaeon]
MKVFADSFTFSTRGEFDFVDLSKKVDDIIGKSGIEEGIALVFAGHATGVIVITEFESRLKQDIQELVEKFIPANRSYHHAGNAFSHLRSMFLTPSKVVPVQKGRLALGTWQSIFWVETETRPRTRKVEVYVIGKSH